MSIFSTSRTAFRLAALAGLIGASSLSTAASHCQGMAENACGTDSGCVWVQSYTRKDGREVASHCKLKPAKQSEQTASTDAPRPGSAH